MRLTARARASRRALIHRTLGIFAVIGVATLLLIAAASKPQPHRSGAVTPPASAAAIN